MAFATGLITSEIAKEISQGAQQEVDIEADNRGGTSAQSWLDEPGDNNS